MLHTHEKSHVIWLVHMWRGVVYLIYTRVIWMSPVACKCMATSHMNIYTTRQDSFICGILRHVSHALHYATGLIHMRHTTYTRDMTHTGSKGTSHKKSTDSSAVIQLIAERMTADELIAERIAQNLEIISESIQISSRRTRTLTSHQIDHQCHLTRVHSPFVPSY